jgi:hypothetical protein
MDNTGRADVRLRLHIPKIKINHSSLILLNRLVKGMQKHGRNWKESNFRIPQRRL